MPSSIPSIFAALSVEAERIVLIRAAAVEAEQVAAALTAEFEELIVSGVADFSALSVAAMRLRSPCLQAEQREDGQP